jgi:enediyne biosynthesis protein E8
VPLENAEHDPDQILVLEAFADTIVPGAKRSPEDRAIAGVVDDPGAVEAGAVTLLADPAGGLAPALEVAAMELDEYATEYAREHDLTLDADVPPFVALSFADRTALVARLCAPDHPEKQMWVGLALFSNMAYDSGAHLSTAEALSTGHPGLLGIGFAPPQEDGLWRFPRFSYGRQLADLHPHTTSTGSPS